MSAFQWTSAAVSHVGRVRDINEDSCLELPGKGMWAVADGMGGHASGDFASRLVVEQLGRIEASRRIGELVNAVRRCLLSTNRQLREEAALRQVPIIGSTAVVLVASERSCGYLWAGDSRLYLLRNHHLKQLTRDHNQLEERRRRGDLPPEDSADYPSRNLITRAVGAMDLLDLDEQTLKVSDGDMFLLCSDGLSNEVNDAEITTALLSGNCRQAAESLTGIALERGGRDNISVVVVRADDPESTERTLLNPAL